MEHNEQPGVDDLRRIIYIYNDGQEYEMIDVQNYVDNLKATGALLATRSYIQMKEVRYKKTK